MEGGCSCFIVHSRGFLSREQQNSEKERSYLGGTLRSECTRFGNVPLCAIKEEHDRSKGRQKRSPIELGLQFAGQFLDHDRRCVIRKMVIEVTE
jgi:hypothetical protein